MKLEIKQRYLGNFLNVETKQHTSKQSMGQVELIRETGKYFEINKSENTT